MIPYYVVNFAVQPTTVQQFSTNDSYISLPEHVEDDSTNNQCIIQYENKTNITVAAQIAMIVWKPNSTDWAQVIRWNL